MQKALFYGNCQLGVLARHFRTHGCYQLYDCRDFGLKSFWVEPGLFAAWADPDAHRKEVYSQITKAVKSCDVFIFQNHKPEADKPYELTTDYLYEQASQALKICVPSFWYNVYSSIKSNAVVRHLYEQGQTLAQILHFLRYETNDFAKQLLCERHSKDIAALEERHRIERSRYSNFVPCSSYIQDNYALKLLAYTHSHPSYHYFNYLLDSLEALGIAVSPRMPVDSDLPSAALHELWIGDLFYFRQFFPNMEDLEPHRKFYTLEVDEAAVQQQINLIEEENRNAAR